MDAERIRVGEGGGVVQNLGALRHKGKESMLAGEKLL